MRAIYTVYGEISVFTLAAVHEPATLGSSRCAQDAETDRRAAQVAALDVVSCETVS